RRVARRQPRAHGRAVLEQQALILFVAHVVDHGAQPGATRTAEYRFEALAVLQIDNFPAVAREHLAQALSAAVRNHPVEALTVEVDHPQHASEPLREFLAERLPDVALVELGVADQRDLPAGAGPAGI